MTSASDSENAPEATAKLSSIVVVGGGSTGWTAAAILQQALGRDRTGCRIIVVDPEPAQSVDGTEAAFPAFSEIFRFLDVPEHQWMDASQATFSLGTRFEGWRGDSDGFWHIFGMVPLDGGGRISPIQVWVRDWLAGETVDPFARALYPGTAVAEAGQAPKNAFDEGSAQLPYGFHLDTLSLAAFMKEHATARGVVHLQGPVEAVEKDGERITAVQLATGERLLADLYLDCTGSRGLLIGGALDEPWIDWSGCLPCDRTVVIKSGHAPNEPYNEPGGGIAPYTTVTALEAGWAWRAPLVGRLDAGYIYSSAYLEPEAAERKVREHIAPRAAESRALHSEFRTGRRQRPWVGNCVAIGRAAGIAEPLVPAGLTLVQEGLFQLLHELPDTSMPDLQRARYNCWITDRFDGVRDFVALPYALTQRGDSPFWQAAQSGAMTSGSLAAQIAKWRQVWPTSPDRPSMFGPFDVCSMLAGMGALPERATPASLFSPNTNPYRQRVTEVARRLTSELPAHAEYFRQRERIADLRSAEDW